MPCAPQRFLGNERNLIASAASLAPSSVRPIALSVQEIALARSGTAKVSIAGDYSGAEEATFDIRSSTRW
jgi:hypothetical protein